MEPMHNEQYRGKLASFVSLFELFVLSKRHEFPPNLVPISEHGIKGENYYFRNSEKLGINKKELRAAGAESDEVYIHQDIVKPLQSINQILEAEGMCLFIKEGYRSEASYKIAYDAHVRKRIKEGLPQEDAVAEADKLFDLVNMPHTSGKAVDVVFYDLNANKQILLRDGEREPDSKFLDFHKRELESMPLDHPKREEYEQYQARQERLITLMQNAGFRLGQKNEYWHFDYQPDTPPTYPSQVG